jgi:uncharacterized protein YecE (DUF72 family)
VGVKATGKILVGISSWTEPTLIASRRFYPSFARTAEARLRFYSSQFPIVEVDSTYYAIPDPKTGGLWATRTPDNFIFDAKAFRLFTHHPTQPAVLPGDVRLALPQDLQEKRNLYYRDMPAEILDELWRRFEDALLPLDSAGKLGVITFQFPPWFFPGNEQRDYILECRRRLPQYRIAIEFRHGSWVNEKNRDRTFAFLRENKLTYVSVDEPQVKTAMPPIAEATSDFAVTRFHGRNIEAWEKENLKAADRFNYLYAQEELAEWAPRVKLLAAATKEVHVIFNNCYSDKAVNNARDMARMLGVE